MENSATINPESVESDVDARKLGEVNSNTGEETVPPYQIPPWNHTQCHRYFLRLLKDRSIVRQFHIHEKGNYMSGRAESCDFVIHHQTVSLSRSCPV
ncbi:hypothetical protein OROMI_012499 [Orobanche minor]